jgi:CheY-like chemotaxis protein/DNA-binding XRE family transcriptional regulator
MDIEKKFGIAVRTWREKLKFSQEDLATRADLHRTYISDIERGARNVSLKNVEKLSEALGIPLATLFADLSARQASAPMTLDEQVDILVVEDNAEDLALTMRALKDFGMTNRIYAVQDGASALDFLFGTGSFSHRRPSDLPLVILLDLHLPKIAGLEVLRRIKADPRTSRIPVIILSGSKDAQEMGECKRLGVQDYILKPVDVQSFSEVSLRLDLQWVLVRPEAASPK